MLTPPRACVWLGPLPRFSSADNYPTGPKRLILVGPPGTGKTRTAVEGFVLSAFYSDAGRSVLACSFTRSAAGVLRERMSAEVGGNSDDYRRTACTVHSEALRLVVRATGKARLVGGRVVTDPDDEEVWGQGLFGPQHLQDALAADQRSVAMRMWDLARSRFQESELERAYHDVQPTRYSLAELKAEIGAYEAEKRDDEEMDFVDLLRLSLTLEPPPRELVLVDEVQDSSPLMWRLFERWGAAARWFVLIGDPDQAVHRWCGADPERLQELSSTFAVRRLAQSYRVPRAQHRLAAPLIALNRGRFDAPYEPADRDGDAHEAEPEEVLTAAAEAASSDLPTLILARSRTVLGRYARDLAAFPIPFRNERGYSPLGTHDRRQIARAVVALREDHRISAGAVLTLLDALPAAFFPPKRKAAQISDLEEHCSPTETVSRSDLEALGITLTPVLGNTLQEALSCVRLARTAGLRRRAAEDLARLIEACGATCLETEPSVVLTTAHAAKGREAPLVIVDLEAPRPVLRSLFDVRQLESERNLLYVALTRSEDRTLLVRHGRRDLGEELGLGRLP